MPKVSDYELEHFDDDRFEQNKREKRKKPVKERKYSDKPNYRKDWKKYKKQEESFEEIISNDEEEDLSMKEVDE